MKKVIIIALILVVGLLVPAVSAEIIIDETLSEFADTGGSRHVVTGTGSHSNPPKISDHRLVFKEISNHPDTKCVIITRSGNRYDEGEYAITYNLNGVTRPATKYVTHQKNLLGAVTHTRIEIFFDDWDIGSLVGTKYITFSQPLWNSENGYRETSNSGANDLIYILPTQTDSRLTGAVYDITVVSVKEWKNHIKIESDNRFNTYMLKLTRVIDTHIYASTVDAYKTDSLVFQNGDSKNLEVEFVKTEIDKIELNSGKRLYTYPLTTYAPDDPEEPTVMRTGTVTMTDNNGTTISDFEVTAVNHYTGEEYTVSTETDVAVITLPMDRTIRLRNPQTGEYEEAPVGYYRFYGQAPGYRMLNEDGIQVSVMPEKYGSYQLCDIRVTSESGYLTGLHKFQIRSRTDNSILQSGTISAKSATTGEWYNATVSGGIATLTLTYDTSNVVSQYVGNYYVYATSPGYQDSEYGTQIVVMPHTVSEIKSILLTPIGGIPPAGNVTLRIQAFSETGQGIPNAEIFISGVQGAGASVWDTYNASSTGYLTVYVPANSTYDIVASGTGYYDSARRIEVFDTDPALIEIKLYLSGMPTVEPTTQPTGWITPTPTQTTPPIQEDNIIGLSVKGLAKGFGIDYDTALLMFGLMIIFGAGGMVMSSVKGGAMEFIAGSIVGTFVAFALGLIPIWIFIIIAVVFGAYVLRVFVQGGQ